MTPANDMVHEHTAKHLSMFDLLRMGDTVATLGEWCDALGLKRNAVHKRIRKGATALDALRPYSKHRPLSEPRYERDRSAQRFVAEHPHGATLEEVAEHLGISRARVQQLESAALRKLADAWGPDAEVHLRAMQQRIDRQGWMEAA